MEEEPTNLTIQVVEDDTVIQILYAGSVRDMDILGKNVL
jgi:hypothetical protein